MSRFSWKCIGCGTEINRDEECVLIAGDLELKGAYNGAGGVYEQADKGAVGKGDKVIAWHTYCYDKATDEKKAEKKASEKAKKNGEGKAREKFMNREEKKKEIQALAAAAWDASTALARTAKATAILEMLGIKMIDVDEEKKKRDARNEKARAQAAKRKAEKDAAK